MLQDMQAIVWKEWKELLTGRGFRGGWLNLLVVLGVLGIFLPFQMGRTMVVGSPVFLVVWLWVPGFLVMQVVADSFAGERERHTLETLLASRLSDRAILLGKIVAAMSYGCGLTLVSLALGLVTINLTHWEGRLLVYSPQTALTLLVFIVLSTGFVAAVGVQISLWASTVRQAYQVMSIGIIILLFGGIYGIPAIVRALPAGTAQQLSVWFTSANLRLALLVFVFVLAAVDAGLFAAALARFRRAKLILD